jgi:hypothetical protein
MSRTFTDEPAKRGHVPLLVGIVGPSSSGKTFSALRLATGIQRVVGGQIFGIDTEHKRMTHYSDKFAFRHVDFEPPFGPLDYLDAIQHCVKQGAKIIVVDSMTHEHNGIGGVTDQSEQWLDKQCGNDYQKRQRMQMLSWVNPKQERKKLNSAIVQLGINAIFCYRAADKIKPVSGKEPIKLGWTPETTSTLHYDMVQRFLLTPGCDGVPSFLPEMDAEKQMVKNPAQFRDWFKPGVQLSEEIGERMARWAAGDATEKTGKQTAPEAVSNQVANYEICQTEADFKALESLREQRWKELSGIEKKALKAASDAAKDRLSKAVAAPDAVVDDGINEPAPTGELFTDAADHPTKEQCEKLALLWQSRSKSWLDCTGFLEIERVATPGSLSMAQYNRLDDWLCCQPEVKTKK